MKILFIDFSTKLESVNDLAHRARGGMVTSLFRVSDALSQFGHNVCVLSDIKKAGKSYQGVSWVNLETGFPEMVDALVCNRGIGRGYAQIRARHRVLWTHDLPHSGFATDPKMFGAFSRVVFMSRYAERVWRTFFKTIRKSVLIPNGVDKNIFKPLPKKKGQMIFCSAPNRGLKRIPLIYEAVKTRVGFPVAMKAFSNMGKLHPNEVRDENQDGFSLAYKDCRESGVDLRNPIPQNELAKELGESELMILPTDYPEICSNVILQSLSCGTPVFTTGNLGSSKEWVAHFFNGALTTFHPVDYMVYTVEMVRNIVAAYESKYMEQLSKNAAKTKIYSWEKIGKKWNKMLTRLK